MTYDILGRRADGRGTIEFERNYSSLPVSENTAKAIFDSDHSLTMVWVMDRQTKQAVEVFTRPATDKSRDEPPVTAQTERLSGEEP